MKISVKEMCLVGLFSVLIAIGAFIKVPVSIVPITLQTLFVLLAALLLNKKLATVSVLIYIVIGLIGLPVFASGGGISYVLMPSFGYLIGFVLCSYFVSYLKEKCNNIIHTLILCILGMLLIYLIGMIYFYIIELYVYKMSFDLGYIFYYLFLVYLPGDVLSCFAAILVYIRVKDISVIKLA